MKSYHLVLGILLVAGTAAFGATDEKSDDPLPPRMISPPPRTVDDILKVVDHYRPDPEEATRARAGAEAAPPETGDMKVLGDFYFGRALNATKSGRTKQGLSDFRTALGYFERGSDDHLRIMRRLASAETTTGNLLEGIRVAEELLTLIPPRQPGKILPAAELLVHQYSLAGDFASARKHLQAAEGAFATLRKSRQWPQQGDRWTANIERARGVMLGAEGNLTAAELAFRKALKAEAGNHARLAGGQTGTQAFEGSRRYLEVIRRHLAGVLMKRGMFLEAELTARDALRSSLERVGNDSTDAGQGLSLLGRIVAEQGRYAEALSLAEAAARTYRASGAGPESRTVIVNHKLIGSLLVSMGRYEQALHAFKRIREANAVEPEVLRTLGAGDLDWVLAMLRTGDQKGAEGMAKRILDYWQKRVGDKDIRTQLPRAFLAMTLMARGDLASARAGFEESVPPLIAQMLETETPESGSLKRQQRMTLILESYIRVLSEPPATKESMATAFLLADIARSSNVQRAIAASAARTSFPDPRLAELARREQDIQGRIVSLSELLTQLLATPPEEQLPTIQAKLATDIAALKAERAKLKQEIGQTFPDYAELVDPKPVTVTQAQKYLKPGETLLSYYLGEDRSYVWALRADGTLAFSPIPADRRAIAATLTRLRSALDPQVAAINELPAFDAAAAHALYIRLVGPVAGSLNGTSLLLVVPHGELGQLPLAVLPTEPPPAAGKSTIPFDDYRNLPWLIRKVAIEQLPSITSLNSLRRQPPADPSRKSFIGFGDPLFSKDQAAEAPVQIATGVKTRGVPLRLRSVPKTEGVSSAELALLPRLPDTGQEISEIAQVLRAGAEDIFLRGKATERSVFAADLSKRRVVMFATHGLVPGELNGLTQPALALTTPDLADGNGDGLLAMDEILSLKLDADWVVLSACNTAAGAGAGAEAVSGLGRAFFYAGARALLVSNWPVETTSARLLMTDIFRRQVANPSIGKAEALRQAMLALADGPGSVDPVTRKTLYFHAHPLFWAPFVVVGD